MTTILKSILTTTLIMFSTHSVFAADPASTMTALKAKLAKLGEPKVEGTEKVEDKTLPALYFGKRKINNDKDIVDDIKKSNGGAATIFVKSGTDFVRITTNVLKKDGTRALGTELKTDGAAYKAISKGETFCGEVDLFDTKYDSCYEPIKVGSETVGVYFVGVKK